MTVLAIVLPRWFGVELLAPKLEAPFELQRSIGSVVFSANAAIALIGAPLVMAGLALFLQRSRLGVAIRGSADRADRAALLGVPVRSEEHTSELQSLMRSSSAVFCLKKK